MGWMSIRNSWPQEPGKYKVLDCRNETQTKTRYDGFEFVTPVIFYGEIDSSKKFIITHWKEIRDKQYDDLKLSIDRQRERLEKM